MLLNAALMVKKISRTVFFPPSLWSAEGFLFQAKLNYQGFNAIIWILGTENIKTGVGVSLEKTF